MTLNPQPESVESSHSSVLGSTPLGSVKPESNQGGRSGGSFWTPEREELLTDMWNVKEMTPREIAGVLECTRDAVIGKAHRLGLNRRENPVKRLLSKEERHARQLERARKKAARAEQIRLNEELLLAGGVLPIDLENHHCRFPIGNPDEPGFHFCGARREVLSSYCEFHDAKCHWRP